MKLRIAIKNCTHTSFGKSLLHLAADWAIIGGATTMAYRYSWTAPLALIVIGTRQRALQNLLHEASHFNLFPGRTAGDVMTNLTVAFPLLEDANSYREEHHLHHSHLGDPSLDPDERIHFDYGATELSSQHPGLSALIFNVSSWRHSLLCRLPEAALILKFKLIVFWAAIAGLLLATLGPEIATHSLTLWWLAKATSYHGIRVLADYFDHSGLVRGSVYSYSRLLPHHGWARLFLSPHNDTYHLLHHLYPSVPHYNLPKLHEHVIRHDERYRQSSFCDSYFTGDRPVIADLWRAHGQLS